jgi:hypothetical protein
VLDRDRVETTRVAVALVAWEGKAASADGEPSARLCLNLDHESDRARIAGGGFRGLEVFELRFEPSVQEVDDAGYGAFSRRRSARWRRFRSTESRRARSACVKAASRVARCLSHFTRSARVI